MNLFYIFALLSFIHILVMLYFMVERIMQNLCIKECVFYSQLIKSLSRVNAKLIVCTFWRLKQKVLSRACEWNMVERVFLVVNFILRKYFSKILIFLF